MGIATHRSPFCYAEGAWVRFRTTEIAAAVGGTISGPDRLVEGVNHDSRLISPGELFVPIVADRDGHNFIDQAVKAGATAFLSSQDRRRDSNLATAIYVGNTIEALAQLGKLARTRLAGDVIGVTGSVGKTTVKDLLSGVLAQGGLVNASTASFNNEIGVPLTLANANTQAKYVIAELGARGIGHIQLLCDIARPNVGVVTRVAMAHGEHFGSLDDIAVGKGELVEQLPDDGLAVLNADDRRVIAMSRRTTARVLSFGTQNGEIRIDNLVVDEDLSIRFKLHTPWGEIAVQPSAKGEHNAMNAAAAAAVGLGLGLRLEEVAQGLATAPLSPLRMALKRLTNGAVVLDDSYNANPTSMKAALMALAKLPAQRRIAVLGVMAELGENQDGLHREVAAFAAELGIEVLTVAAPAYEATEFGGIGFDSVDEALGYLTNLEPDTAVLAKGSRVAELDRLVRSLTAE